MSGMFALVFEIRGGFIATGLEQAGLQIFDYFGMSLDMFGVFMQRRYIYFLGAYLKCKSWNKYVLFSNGYLKLVKISEKNFSRTELSFFNIFSFFYTAQFLYFNCSLSCDFEFGMKRIYLSLSTNFEYSV